MKTYRKAIIAFFGVAGTVAGMAFGIPVPQEAGEFVGTLIVGAVGAVATGVSTYMIPNDKE